MTSFLPVALSEEVTSAAPLGVSIGEQQIVLWRDVSGNVNALEDRCPHRRAPLSLGCVRTDGLLQCGYHGWSFDGAGHVVELPQMRREAKLPAVYRATRFFALEADGFVYVASEEHTSSPPPLPLLERHGSHISALDRDRWIELLLDAPQVLIDISGIQITEYLLADPDSIDESIVYERACRRRGGLLPDRLRAEFPLSLRMDMQPDAGLCRATLRDPDRKVLLDMVLGIVPARRGVTAIRWRATASRRAAFEFRALDGGMILSTPRTASTVLRGAEASNTISLQHEVAA